MRVNTFRYALVLAVVSAAVQACFGAVAAEDEAAATAQAALQELASYEFGESPACIRNLHAALCEIHETPELRETVVSQMVGLLGEPISLDAKQAICRELALFGTPSCVPAVAALLADEATCDMARYALENLPYPGVDEALVGALSTAHGRARVGIVNTLGDRRSVAAADALGPLTLDSDAEVAEAALVALGKIAEARGQPLDASATFHQRLLAAHRLRLAGRNDEALAAFQALIEASPIDHVRAAAFLGRVAIQRDEALAEVVSALACGNAAMESAAACGARFLEGEKATQALAAALPNLAPETQAVLLTALAERGDAAALNGAMACSETGPAEVRVAAIRAVAALGNDTTIGLLARIAAHGPTTEECEAARAGLVSLRGVGTNAAFLKLVPESEPAESVELVKALAARGATEAVEALFRMVHKPGADPSVRIQLLKSLAELAPGTNTPTFIGLVHTADDERIRHWAAHALVMVARKIADEVERNRVMIDGWRQAPNEAARIAMLTAFSELGDASYVGILEQNAREGPEETRKAAIRALRDWPTPDVLGLLIDIAEQSQDEAFRTLALKGVTRLLRMQSDRDEEQDLRYCDTALTLAQDAATKESLLSVLAGVYLPEALDVAKRFIDDPTVRGAAILAAHQIIFARCAVRASHNQGDTFYAIDSNPETAWNSGVVQETGMWLSLDLGTDYEIHGVVFDAAGTSDCVPTRARVCVANSLDERGEPACIAEGGNGMIAASFPPRRGRCIIIEIDVPKAGKTWTVNEVQFVTPETEGLTLRLAPPA
ncbi:MAG TPA: hypothetical protein PLO37_15215 [Candidatus Hydrogenedentes bacterium]|nr:hypothetical protein [Candidatus Hydrogenedentota bacterium]